MKYFNLAMLAIFLLLSSYAIWDVYQEAIKPLLLDGYSYQSRYWEVVFLLVGVVLYPFTTSPWWFPILYLPSSLWVVVVYILPYVCTSTKEVK